MLSFYLALIDNESSQNLLEQIYLHHRQTMIYVANRILHDQMLAEDATHDAFIRIMNHLSKITDPYSCKTRSFVVLIVKSVALDYYRRKIRLAESSFEKYDFIYDNDYIDMKEISQNRDISEYMRLKISKLRPAYAEVLTLKYSFEYTDLEIAQLLGISCETVRTRLRRAKQHLRIEFEEAGDINETYQIE